MSKRSKVYQDDLIDTTEFVVVALPFEFSQIDKIGNNANIGIRGPYYVK